MINSNKNRNKEQSANISSNKPILSKSINKPVLGNVLNIQNQNKNLKIKETENVIFEKIELPSNLNSKLDKYDNNKFRFSVSDSKINRTNKITDFDSNIPEIDSEVENDYYDSYKQYKGIQPNINYIDQFIDLEYSNEDEIKDTTEYCKFNEYLINPPILELTSLFIEYERRYGINEFDINN